MEPRSIRLNYDSGNIISPAIHGIGILALGSHLENHGPALPIDTDAKIASYLALEASNRTGAKFLGIVYGATEHPYIKHGIHIKPVELIDRHLKPILECARKSLKIRKALIVNGHGGNTRIKKYLPRIAEETGVEIKLNNKIVEIEGPHAGSGEVSIGLILGIADPKRLRECENIEEYPEIGMIGLKEARERDKKIDEGARQLENEGVYADPILGRSLLEEALKDIIKDIKLLLDG
ncbi:MAG TPA: 2-amino-5-formylamino-6-ribosylaminopyrimidin-4(3H)-one 5'-monophosphate deformylase [Methanothermobacter sp.]|mgnify:CR=1 FL=1|jgi:2-amino-5-formylamino-6-ribosylaminopyrimidin-4(3H)-one 5'-monophosphate deformylase|uniref:2-amino-5-formylamino-6-ribosylaminopyrimidin-4(3H)-one 5'-monophosphate deformylase n=1 Tax=Methanothermobacter tenebrarum TaxID=680118 RepID=A0ABN6PEL3_9EURY|nr:2-amino-5-formylamino-6-ribosylaminopyrimidin-4(3H)-one 5'-monophosphate deformylase [Methanothermobacter tenebrarum]MDD3453881.1 2-amino-5-formylamino-6-ribosylaminopyrimidin-4(3H)-one 5'-monophosphate deformylase [Methanobacteriales archaeon]MDX9692592.1 2-amino-5-formylamino-6-ribosylaminopyrimidin-4(3H)-one 5'-monophosphate deformylase [Methanothermobacter sp.]BDH79246.1 2-amino-5-formylamino-6-ribosylaminopyrimidin-4(3H)-one 5'-monophosphate deformylase [Methanothermobacter tenebrarum]H